MKALLLTSDQEKTILDIVKRYFPKKAIWVFGSRIHPEKVKPFSDLDLAIMGTEKITGDLLGRASEDFSASDLPFKVDLVEFQNLPPQMRENIKKEHIVFFEP